MKCHAASLLALTVLALLPADGSALALAAGATPPGTDSGYIPCTASGVTAPCSLDAGQSKPFMVPLNPPDRPSIDAEVTAPPQRQARAGDVLDTVDDPSITAATTPYIRVSPNITALGSPPTNLFAEYLGFLPKVQQFTVGGDARAASYHTSQVAMGHGNRSSGSQSARHVQGSFVGSGANGEPNADIANSFSLIKQGWPTYDAVAGEGDVLACNGRQTGPISGTGAGLSDMNCLSGNIQNTKGSGYLAGVEMSVSDIDPANGYAFDHGIGIQAGVVNSRDESYEGYFAASNNGANGAAYHASGSTNGSAFALLVKNTTPCRSGSSYTLQDTFTQSAADGAMTWTPCPVNGRAASALTLKSDGGTLKVLNAAGGLLLAIDQGGNTTIAAGSLIKASYTKANLPRGDIAGREAYCSDCLKPGEAAGAGTGMPVFHDASHSTWYTMAGAVAAN